MTQRSSDQHEESQSEARQPNQDPEQPQEGRSASRQASKSPEPQADRKQQDGEKTRETNIDDDSGSTTPL